jgi:hypothetical protein
MASTGGNARIGTLFTDEAKNQLVSKSEGRFKPSGSYQEDPIVILSELQIVLRPGNSYIGRECRLCFAQINLFDAHHCGDLLRCHLAISAKIQLRMPVPSQR